MDNNMMRGGMDNHKNEEKQIPSLKHAVRNGYANMKLHGTIIYIYLNSYHLIIYLHFF